MLKRLLDDQKALYDAGDSICLSLVKLTQHILKTDEETPLDMMRLRVVPPELTASKNSVHVAASSQ